MNKYSIFLKKYEHFRKHPGMYLVSKISGDINIEYETAAAFIAGLDYFQGEGVMNEFREWLLSGSRVENNAFGWPYLVRFVYESSEECLMLKIDLVEFLFKKVDAFLKIKM